MGNTQKRKDGVLTFADLDKEVEKSSENGGKVFRFAISPDQEIEVPPPTWEEVEQINKAMQDQDTEQLFRILLGEQYDAVMDAFRGRDARLFMFFQKHLIEFYDLGEALA